MRKKYFVTLTDAQRQELGELVSTGQGAARLLAHARLLLKADRGPGGPAWQDEAIAVAIEVSTATVERVRKQFATQGLEAALRRRPARRYKPRKLDGAQEARLVAVACGAPPEGQARWSLRLLADKLVQLEVVDAISYESVRRTLKKTSSSRG